MKIHKHDTAVVVSDPQHDVLSEKGVSWRLVGDSGKENNPVENLARRFRAAKAQGFGVFISPHYLYPTDQAWPFGGAVETMMLEGKEFWRPGPGDGRRREGQEGADGLISARRYPGLIRNELSLRDQPRQTVKNPIAFGQRRKT